MRSRVYLFIHRALPVARKTLDPEENMETKRQILWSHLASPGMEHVRIATGSDGITADGVVLGVENGVAYRMHYGIHCDTRWRFRRVSIDMPGEERSLSLFGDGEGRWFDVTGNDVPVIDGCIEADIQATPFTNTPPIRRLALGKGESAVIAAAYVTVPELRVIREEQRYTFLGDLGKSLVYRFEQMSSGFTAEIRIDREGVVEEYPGLFGRVWDG